MHLKIIFICFFSLGPKTLTGLNPLYIIIIVISIVVVVFIVFIMAYYLRRRRSKNLVDKNVAMDECNAEVRTTVYNY